MINQHHLLQVTATLCGLVSFGSINAETTPLENSKPNIILVMTDDQGLGEFSWSGSKLLQTPHLDEFHANSTRFTDFQVSPTCAPTRAAIMSGRFPFRVGVTHTILQRERMSPEVYTMPQMLKSAGYTTALFGKWHLGDDPEYLPQARGFDEVLMHGAGGIGQTRYGDFAQNADLGYDNNFLLHNETIVQAEGYCTDVFFGAAEDWIFEQEQSQQPYFAYIALNAPHAPMYAPERNKKRFLEAGYRKDTAARLGMVENIDENFGRMMSKLEKWGALDNTLVIFMTDNGMAHGYAMRKGKRIDRYNAGMRGAKNSPYEGGTHVPSLWHWDKLGKGVDISALTAHIDLYQTFAKLAGANLPDNMQDLDGRSLLPLLENPKAEWEDRKLFIHCGRWKSLEMREAHQYKTFAVRTEKWRFVNDSMLHDIENDPGETVNLYEEKPEIVAELRAVYDQWWNQSLPLMINEGLPNVEEWYFHKLYQAQKSEGAFPKFILKNY